MQWPKQVVAQKLMHDVPKIICIYYNYVFVGSLNANAVWNIQFTVSLIKILCPHNFLLGYLPQDRERLAPRLLQIGLVL